MKNSLFYNRQRFSFSTTIRVPLGLMPNNIDIMILAFCSFFFNKKKKKKHSRVFEMTDLYIALP